MNKAPARDVSLLWNPEAFLFEQKGTSVWVKRGWPQHAPEGSIPFAANILFWRINLAWSKLMIADENQSTSFLVFHNQV